MCTFWNLEYGKHRVSSPRSKRNYNARVARCSSLIRVFSVASRCPMLAVAACRFICCCLVQVQPCRLKPELLCTRKLRAYWRDQRPTATSSLPVTEAYWSRRDRWPTATAAMAPSPIHLSVCPTRCLYPGRPGLSRPRGGFRYLQPVCLNNRHHHKGFGWQAS
jgi:hypothetical protein